MPSKVNKTALNLSSKEAHEDDAFAKVSRHLLDNMPECAILTLNQSLQVDYANDYACTLFKLNYNQSKQSICKLSNNIHALIKDELTHGHYEFKLQVNNSETISTFKCYASYNTNPKALSHCYTLYIFDQTQWDAQQTQLMQTEQLLQTLMDASPDYICIKDGHNRWLRANKKLLDLIQSNHEDYYLLTNHEISKRVHPIFSSMLQFGERSDEDTWLTKRPYRNEEIVFLPHGDAKKLETTKTAHFGPSDERQHLVMFAKDVTEQQFVNAQLQNRSAILDALISCDWLLHSADSWKTVAKTVLQQCCLAFRFTRGAILKMNKGELNTSYSTLLYQWAAPGFMSPSKNLEAIDFNCKALKRWHDILQKGNPVFTEIHALPEHERQLLKQHDCICIAIVPLFLEGKWWGNIIIERCYDADKTSSQEIGALMAISRSLGVAIQREEANKSLNLAKIAFDSATEGMMIIDTNGSIIGINASYTNITGYKEEEILGKTPLVFQVGKHSLWESLANNSEWCGELINYKKNGEPFHERLTITVVRNELSEITNYVGVFSDVSDIKKSQEALNKLVNHDPLTGLPNRRLINELIEKAIQRAEQEKHKIAILFIDIDRFKSINDSLGHQFGDKLLYEISTKIKQSIRESDVAGRLGGDEFIVMMDNINNKQNAENKAKKILSALQSEFKIDGKEILITASIGIALFPDDGIDADTVVKCADIAMYQVKNSGKNNFCFFMQEHSNIVIERFTLESQLRRALERNQFEVFYQPQVNMLTKEIIGAEALVRWRHPELGLVSPDKFIPLAEETGLILQIGQWVLTQAALQAKLWVSQQPGFKHISVNVSGIQIMQSNFADTVYGVLIETDCNPSMLELEITESTVMLNTEFVINTFNKIKNLGLSLAIDDFGTGYSSLSNLKRLPLDKLKIDRSFVQDLPEDENDAAIAQAIYAMASSLGFSVIAEGVETETQERFLIDMGCAQAQGFRYSKPVSAHDLSKMIFNKTTFKEVGHEQ